MKNKAPMVVQYLSRPVPVTRAGPLSPRKIGPPAVPGSSSTSMLARINSALIGIVKPLFDFIDPEPYISVFYEDALGQWGGAAHSPSGHVIATHMLSHSRYHVIEDLNKRIIRRERQGVNWRQVEARLTDRHGPPDRERGRFVRVDRTRPETWGPHYRGTGKCAYPHCNLCLYRKWGLVHE